MKFRYLFLALLVTTAANASIIEYEFFLNLPFDDSPIVTAGLGTLQVNTDSNTLAVTAQPQIIDLDTGVTVEPLYVLTGSFLEAEEPTVLTALDFLAPFTDPAFTLHLSDPNVSLSMTRFPGFPFEELIIFDQNLGVTAVGSWVTDNPLLIPEPASLVLFSVGLLLLVGCRLPKRGS